MFGYLGVGDVIIDALNNRDFPVLTGAFFFMMVIVLLFGVVGDFVLVRLDPRLRK